MQGAIGMTTSRLVTATTTTAVAATAPLRQFLHRGTVIRRTMSGCIMCGLQEPSSLLMRSHSIWLSPTSLGTTTTTTTTTTIKTITKATTMRSISFFSKQPSADKKEDMKEKEQEDEYLKQQKKYSVYDHLTGYFRGRSEKDNDARMKAQIEQMANSEVWTLHDFEKTLDDQLKSWGAKLSWFTGNKELKLAKQAQSVVKAIVEMVGRDATSEALEELGRKEKLKLSYKSGASVEDINTLFTQFHSTALMHRVIRLRKEQGKPIPLDAESLKQALNTDGRNLMSKHQVAQQKKRAISNMKSMIKTRRPS